MGLFTGLVGLPLVFLSGRPFRPFGLMAILYAGVVGTAVQIPSATITRQNQPLQFALVTSGIWWVLGALLTLTIFNFSGWKKK